MCSRISSLLSFRRLHERVFLTSFHISLLSLSLSLSLSLGGYVMAFYLSFSIVALYLHDCGFDLPLRGLGLLSRYALCRHRKELFVVQGYHFYAIFTLLFLLLFSVFQLVVILVFIILLNAGDLVK